MSNNKSIKKALLLAIIPMVLLASLAFSESKYFTIAKNLDILSELLREVDDNYVDDIKPAGMIRKGIDAMLASLDPYTNYISEAQVETYKIKKSGAAGNIGVELAKRDKFVMITAVEENLAAHKAQLLPGDIITAIDGKSTSERSVEEVKQVLTGMPGSEVKLSIKRIGEAAERNVKVIRDKGETTSVPYFGMVGENTAYIKLRTFLTRNCSGEVKEALNTLREDNDVQSVILDLRHNGGGLLAEAINMVNIFVPKDLTIVTTQGKMEEWNNKKFITKQDPIAPDLPLAILVDGRSASASEIVSGSIQDLDRGVIIGTQSFGKGLVQQHRSIGYNSQLKLTVSKYFIPSGRCVQAIDYSGRYHDGGVVEVPDSLKKAFKTTNGRTVYDGSGVAPDVVVEKPESTGVVKSVKDKHLLLDYAVAYNQKHDSIAAPEAFNLTDKDFDDFVKFVANKEYDYDTETETAMNELRESLEKEKYNGAVTSGLTQLESKLKTEKARDLTKNKAQIMRLLRGQIVKYRYFQKGYIQSELEHDEDVLKALELFANPDEYKKILAGG